MKRTIPFLILAALLAWSGCAALEGQDLSAEPTSDDGVAFTKSENPAEPFALEPGAARYVRLGKRFLRVAR